MATAARVYTVTREGILLLSGFDGAAPVSGCTVRAL